MSRIISEVKLKVREEGKKQLLELKDKLLSPDTIINALQSDINADTCSAEGKEKLKQKADDLKAQLDSIEEIAVNALGTLQGLEDKISGLVDEVDLPEGIPDPIESVQGIMDTLSPLIESLNLIIKAAPAILAAQVSVPGTGGPVSGTVISQTNNNVNLAKGKIMEYVNLFQSIPTTIQRYKDLASPIYASISMLKGQIQPIITQIGQLRMFIVYLEMEHEGKCNDFNVNPNPPIDQPPIINDTSPEMQDIINAAEELYGNLLDSLIGQGEFRGIKRVYELGEEFQKIRNTGIYNLGKNFGAILP